jgi:vacuolar-type H+-ATPase subunit E/Vma4
MGYRELLQALEEEVARQVRERRAEAAQEEQGVLEAARGEIRARRESVLEQERRRLADEATRALSLARLEQGRALLAQMRRAMEELRGAAASRLASMNDADLVTRLVDELVPELGPGALVFRVKPGYEPALEAHLRLKHPELLARATIQASREVGRGVEVTHGGRERLDNTLPSRLQNAWLQLEPQLAALLFEEPVAQGPSEAASQESVASVAGGGDGAV